MEKTKIQIEQTHNIVDDSKTYWVKINNSYASPSKYFAADYDKAKEYFEQVSDIVSGTQMTSVKIIKEVVIPADDIEDELTEQDKKDRAGEEKYELKNDK